MVWGGHYEPQPPDEYEEAVSSTVTSGSAAAAVAGVTGTGSGGEKEGRQGARNAEKGSSSSSSSSSSCGCKGGSSNCSCCNLTGGDGAVAEAVAGAFTGAFRGPDYAGVVRILVAGGSDVGSAGAVVGHSNMLSPTIIAEAVRAGNVKTLRALLDAGAKSDEAGRRSNRRALGDSLDAGGGAPVGVPLFAEALMGFNETLLGGDILALVDTLAHGTDTAWSLGRLAPPMLLSNTAAAVGGRRGGGRDARGSGRGSGSSGGSGGVRGGGGTDGDSSDTCTDTDDAHSDLVCVDEWAQEGGGGKGWVLGSVLHLACLDRGRRSVAGEEALADVITVLVTIGADVQVTFKGDESCAGLLITK